MLATADGLGTVAIMRRTGKSKPCVWRRQERYVAEGVEGLLRDKTRPARKKPLTAEIKLKVLTKTANETPANATHWSVRAMAKEIGISHTSVQRIWAEAGVKPHLTRKFKLSNDPKFAEKVTDVVGLYMNPPDKALVLCVDEKSQIQALDRTQPGLPMKKGRAATMTHDYKRNGTTTLFAALNVKTGEVIGECLPHHRAKEFIRFLKKIDRTVAKHLVERFFAEITGKRIRRGVFKSVAELEAAIDDYLAKNNASPKPFVWTKTADIILEKNERAKAALGAVITGRQALESGTLG